MDCLQFPDLHSKYLLLNLWEINLGLTSGLIYALCGYFTCLKHSSISFLFHMSYIFWSIRRGTPKGWYIKVSNTLHLASLIKILCRCSKGEAYWSFCLQKSHTMLLNVSVEDLFGSLLACLGVAEEQLFANWVATCSTKAIFFLSSFKARKI